MNNGKHGHGTHCTKRGVDNSAENTPNVTLDLFCFFTEPKMSRYLKTYQTACIELDPSLWNYVRAVLWQKWTKNPIGNKSNANCSKYM